MTFSNLTTFVAYPESMVLGYLYLKKIFKNVKSKELREPMKKLLDSIMRNNMKLMELRKGIDFPKQPNLINPFNKKYIPSKIALRELYFRDRILVLK